MGFRSAEPIVDHHVGDSTPRMGSSPKDSHLDVGRTFDSAAVPDIALYRPGYTLGSREHRLPQLQQRDSTRDGAALRAACRQPAEELKP